MSAEAHAARVLDAIRGLAAPQKPAERPIDRWGREAALLRSDPVLALLCRIEAIADDRADNDCSAGAKLAGIVELARMAIAKHTGRPFENPLFEGAQVRR